MTTWQYILLFGSIAASGMLYFIVGRTHDVAMKLSLSFTGAFLFAISIIHLIPEVYGSEPGIGLYVLAGFFIQVIIEFFSEGIEHGHVHKHRAGDKAFPVAMMLGLSFHSFLEAMPLSGDFGHHHHDTLLSGIILHHIPVAFALTGMLAAAGLGRGAVLAYLLLFAAMAPLGALTGALLGHSLDSGAEVYFNRLMGIVIGIFLHISTTILFESNNTHRFNLYKLVVILAGAAFAVVLF